VTIELVHLVWAPLGPEPFARFLDSYRDLAAGTDHRLTLVFKQFGDGVDRAPWERLAATVDHRSVEMPAPALDLDAYRRVAHDSDARRLCFLNSEAVVLAAGWLAALDAALDQPGVGAVGATGSWESTYSSAPIWLKPLRRRRFGPFPNPHLRTNAFMLTRELMLDLDWPEVGLDKVAALALENGRDGISAQIAARGLQTVVVGRDGRSYEPPRWPASGTFRSGAQDNLLVGDNRTAQYRDADPALRRRLAQMAWGDAASDAAAPPDPPGAADTLAAP
jgi:hypothetical protein